MKVTEKIERRFLVKQLPYNLENCEPVHIEQGYLNVDPEVRLKKANHQYSYMVRIRNGRVKLDNEQNILAESFNELFSNITTNVIEKKRYQLILDGGIITTLDVYQGYCEGINIIKVNFDNEIEADSFEKPYWFGEDVTEEDVYKSKNLAVLEPALVKELVEGKTKIKKLF